MVWQAEERYDTILKMVAFLVSPILGLFAALLRINTRSSFIVLFAVFLTFGFSLVTRNESSEDFNFDSVSYRIDFEESIDETAEEFAERFGNYVLMNGDDVDFYGATLNFFISRFTSNYHFLFAVIALVFAYFKLKTLKIFVQEENYHFSLTCLMLLFVFSINQVLKINAFRFYTALMIAVYALFQVLVYGNKKYLWLLAITPFFHATFFLMYLLVPFYYLVRNHVKLFGIISLIVVVPFVVAPSLLADIVSQLIDLIAPGLSHYSAYLSSFYMKEINEDGTGYVWVRRLLELCVWLLIDLVIVFYTFKYKQYIKGTKCEQLYKFLVVLAIFASATIYIPSLGSRFMMLTFPLIAYIYLVCFGNNRKFAVGIYVFAAFYLLCMLFPWQAYQIPCFRYYFLLWEPCFFYASPVYLAIKYLILAA